jgi:Bacterial Ig-like domain (group 3)
MSRTVRKSGRWRVRIARFGSAALACVLSMMLWLVIVPVASADPTPPPTLTDSSTPPAAVGDTITLTKGTYALDPTNASTVDTWYDCGTSAPATPLGCILRQNDGLTYQVTSADQNNFIVVFESDLLLPLTVTPTNSIPVQPPPTPPPPPTPAPPAGSGTPTLSGSPQVDATITATPVTFSNNPSYAYQWMRCAAQCTSITGAITTTYTPTAGDLGDTLMFSETASNAGGAAPQVQSANTAVVTAPTQTTLQITPAGVVAGQTATLIATVTSATGQAPPMGSITFEQAGAPIPGCASITTHPVGASATITCQTAFVGSASTLSAVFTPSPNAQVTGSDSTAIGFVLGRAATAATMVLPTHVTLGKRLTVTAKVAPQAGTEGVSPTGVVVFLDGKKAIKGCSAALSQGVARCQLTYKALGSHSISAVYLGDGNFSGSGTHVHTLVVVVPKPSGYVSSLMTWTFQFKPHYTRVTTLAVTAVAPGLTISVGCSGSGCPRHRYVDTVTRAACGKHGTCKNVNLARRFHGRKLGVGATLTVRLTHPGWLGKYYSFVVRHGRKPKIATACLAVGETRPGAGCTPQ